MTKLIFQIFFLLRGMVVAAPRQGVDLVTKYNQPMLQNYLVEFEPYIFLVGG